ncbi:MAG: hypothetical protein ABSA30_14885 [Candidatus Aminicenantales bacterium]
MRTLSISSALALMALAGALSAAEAFSRSTGALEPADIVWTPVAGPGRKCAVNEDYYFKYEFNEKPKMGMSILKIQVFDRKNNQVAPFKMAGRSDMPSMRGAHDSGDVEFKLNRKNDYLLPVNVAMPGDWEIRVTITLDGKDVFHGSIRFDV